MSDIIYYGQNREDIILNALLKTKKGFYVDVGANDPLYDSVTKFFYDKGWNGINIEPIKSLHNKLIKARKRDINLNIALSDKTGEQLFREYEEHGLSTLNKSTMTEDDRKDIAFKEYKVKIDTLANVLKKQKVTTIDFMKIDVEGLEYEVINGNNWEAYRPKVLCIENNHTSTNKNWTELLKKNKYRLAFNDGINDYYVADEHKDLIDNFDYSRDIILGKRYVYHTVMHELKDRRKRAAILEKFLHEHEENVRAVEEVRRQLENRSITDTSKELAKKILKKVKAAL